MIIKGNNDGFKTFYMSLLTFVKYSVSEILNVEVFIYFQCKLNMKINGIQLSSNGETSPRTLIFWKLNAIFAETNR